MSHQQEWATYRLQLTLLDSETLDESLDQAISMVDKEFQARIETAQDKLEDAQTVGRWLREDVTVDLEENELAVCVQALDTLLRTFDRTNDSRSTPERLRNQLAQTLVGDDVHGMEVLPAHAGALLCG